MMGVREIDRFPEQWQMGIRDLRRRTIMVPTLREREHLKSEARSVPPRTVAVKTTSAWEYQ